MAEHIRQLSKDYDITLIANGEVSEVSGLICENVHFIPLNIERKVSPTRDVLALWKLYSIFRKESFDCIISIMPKSGLLSMLAGFLARTPNRVHMFTGQVWFTKQGVSRSGLKFLDKLLAFCATDLLADSPSQRSFLIKQKVVNSEKIGVLGKGSISGVDVNRFKPDPILRAEIRKMLGINDSAVVFLFMARLTHVKGILDLGRAFKDVATDLPMAHLLVVGPDEDNLDAELSDLIETCSDRVHRIGFTNKPEAFMAASDVFCIPSYREGFSLATIQAAGSGLPAIASRIYGLSDAVSEGITGLFHRPGSTVEISAAMRTLYENSHLRCALSEAAKARAHKDFSQLIIVGEMSSFIRSVLFR